jgi:hypothetical protein
MITRKAHMIVKLTLLSCMLSASSFTISSNIMLRMGSTRAVGASNLFKDRIFSKKGLRGGGTRPWRNIPLEDGEVGFYNKHGSNQPTVMTATDWTNVEDPQLLVNEYPDPQLFTSSLETSDPDIARVLASELSRQQGQLELIASENIVSKAVLQAQANPLS